MNSVLAEDMLQPPGPEAVMEKMKMGLRCRVYIRSIIIKLHTDICDILYIKSIQ